MPSQPNVAAHATAKFVRHPKKNLLQTQRSQTREQMRSDIAQACERGTKCNAQDFKTSWNRYKLHFDTADCGVPISALLSSASMHDSRACIPLALISQQRVINLYDAINAACAAKTCASIVWALAISLG